MICKCDSMGGQSFSERDAKSSRGRKEGRKPVWRLWLSLDRWLRCSNTPLVLLYLRKLHTDGISHHLGMCHKHTLFFFFNTHQSVCLSV